MTIPEAILEIKEYAGAGYLPLIDYGEWRVSILRFAGELLPRNLGKMQRHDETDEVFVLLAGRCILFIGEGQDRIARVYGQDMEPLKLYNIKRGCWHTHTLGQDAMVLIVENRDTSQANSPEMGLDVQQRERILELTRQLWVPDGFS